MKFDANVIDPVSQRCGCLVLGVFENRRAGDAARAVDSASGKALSRHLRRSRMQGKAGQTLLLHGLPGIAAERVLLVGLGTPDGPRADAFRKALARAMAALRDSGASSAAVCLTEHGVAGHDRAWPFRVAVDAARTAIYRFDRMKSKGDESPCALSRVLLGLTERGERATAKTAIAQGVAVADGADLARDLGNLPGNVCTPSFLAEQALELARKHPAVKTRVLGEAEMRKLGMGALLGVARGSREPPRLVAIEYSGVKGAARPVVLVGKGVTFDSGGISIKPAAAMDEMKFDMCGAASVLGAMHAVADLGLPLKVTGLIPATENLPGGSASKPGDIVTSMSGQTVEILNTDAEGRLILCDALAYAARYEPDVVIDIATLTGACVIALGAHASGLFSNDDPLAQALLAAGDYAGDRAWRMPLWEDYQEALSSNFADVANVGGREAGAVTAACFLARFTREYRWAHLDIAGTAWRSGKTKGATGRPVMLLTQYLLDRAAHGQGS